MTELESIFDDALSLKLFGKNVNPTPIKAWFCMANEREIAQWQTGDKELELVLMERKAVHKSVDNFTKERMEEASGERHEVVELLDDDELYRVRRIPIEVVTSQVVKRSGSKRLTLCPFHPDTHPSCVLYGEKGYHCFSCGATGNCVDWVMREYGMEFKEAVRFLKRYC